MHKLNRATVALWRIRGTGSSGAPGEIKVRSNNHANALAIAARRFRSIESCVLIESSPSHLP